MWRKRVVGLLVVCMLMLVSLLVRLAQVQLVETEDFTSHHINLLEASVQQRSQEMVIDNGRGGFLDRNGVSLVDRKIPVLVLFPFLKNMEWNSLEVSRIIGVKEEVLTEQIATHEEPFAFGDPKPLTLTAQQQEQINDLKIPGVFAVERKYALSDILAEQLIGITGENQTELAKRYPNKDINKRTVIGLTGLEKSFDEFLLPDGDSKLVYHVDAKGGPLFGINVKYVEPGNPFYPVNVKTTIDTEIQKMAEALVDQYSIQKGGLVLLDIESNTILASVSRPTINPLEPFANDSKGLQNMMLTEQIVGSVFKTVVAAAAIDYGLDDPNRQFDCSRKINGEVDTIYDHGMLSFTDSFARSCNNTFGTLAKELKEIDPLILETFAKKLSLIGGVGWVGPVFHLTAFEQLPEEEVGRVFLTEEAKRDNNFVALSGIGQHEVRVTPLAVANMMRTIAMGGTKEQVRVATDIQYKNGNSLLTFPRQEQSDTISPFTAMKLQKLLREVVLNDKGTGRVFQELPYAVAGKSGTAETGVFDGENQLHNKWFAGYFPYEKPKYALVTVNLGVYGDQGGVNGLFSDMVKELYQMDQQNLSNR